MYTLPHDQDAMDAELAQYAKNMVDNIQTESSSAASYYDDYDDSTIADESIVSIEDRMTSFDDQAARESIIFLGDAFREIGEELSHFGHGGRNHHFDSRFRHSSSSEHRRLWHQQSNRGISTHQGHLDDNQRGPQIDYQRGKEYNSYESHTLL